MPNKFNLDDIRAIIESEVVSSTSTFTPTYEFFTGLLDKIGEMYMIEANEDDRLEMLDGEMLPYGTTVEEYFIEMLAVVDFDPASTPFAKDRASILKQYHYRNLAKKIELPVSTSQMKRAMLGGKDLSGLLARLLGRITDSKNIYKYMQKKQEIGTRLARIETEYVPPSEGVPASGNPNFANMVQELAIPTDETSAKAYVKAIKKMVEKITKTTSKYNEAQVIKSSKASNLIIFVKEGILPEVGVEALASAFNKGELDIGIQQLDLEDFGEYDGTVHTIIMDKKAIRYLPTLNETLTDVNGNARTVLHTHHFECTLVDSGFANTIVFRPAEVEA